MKNGDLPAFMQEEVNDCNFKGLTKREYFAAHAPHEAFGSVPTTVDGAARELGILPVNYKVPEHYPMLCAKAAVKYADALLAALDKP